MYDFAKALPPSFLGPGGIVSLARRDRVTLGSLGMANKGGIVPPVDSSNPGLANSHPLLSHALPFTTRGLKDRTRAVRTQVRMWGAMCSDDVLVARR